ncbi:RNA polymerase sigma factor [Streptomyces dysideae]|uniref:RNA polymerase subunit sigma n=1 Tax=Streptomyces dysideae TaxID=909626 RepID=A0A101UPD1_9ACTN|nr:RNA polymerase sigma factor [Streptomyces dysideae]KUO14321.1 RNA polymerase subunit sigma [Streptomyces dysideae]
MCQAASREQTFTACVLPEVEVLLRAAAALTARPADAEDLVRDTLLRAYRAMDRFDGEQPRVWLLALMRRAEFDWRHRRTAPDTGPDPTAAAWTAASPKYVVNSHGFDEAVGTVLTSLPDRYRLVVRLVDMGGLSYAEAAGLLGVSERTVTHRVHRARRRMRTRLAAAGAAPQKNTR